MVYLKETIRAAGCITTLRRSEETGGFVIAKFCRKRHDDPDLE